MQVALAKLEKAGEGAEFCDERYMFMYFDTYILMYIYIYICTYIHMYSYIYVHIFICTYIYIDMHPHTHTYVYLCIYAGYLGQIGKSRRGC